MKQNIKQASFIVEVAISEEQTTIIVRQSNGQICTITNNPAEVGIFLDKMVELAKTSNFSNNSNNEG